MAGFEIKAVRAGTEAEFFQPERQAMAVGFEDGFLGAPQVQKGRLLLAWRQVCQPVGFLWVKEAPGEFQGIGARADIFQVAAKLDVFAMDNQQLFAAMAPVDVDIRQRVGQTRAAACIAVQR